MPPPKRKAKLGSVESIAEDLRQVRYAQGLVRAKPEHLQGLMALLRSPGSDENERFRAAHAFLSAVGPEVIAKLPLPGKGHKYRQVASTLDLRLFSRDGEVESRDNLAADLDVSSDTILKWENHLITEVASLIWQRLQPTSSADASLGPRSPLEQALIEEELYVAHWLFLEALYADLSKLADILQQPPIDDTKITIGRIDAATLTAEALFPYLRNTATVASSTSKAFHVYMRLLINIERASSRGITGLYPMTLRTLSDEQATKAKVFADAICEISEGRTSLKASDPYQLLLIENLAERTKKIETFLDNVLDIVALGEWRHWLAEEQHRATSDKGLFQAVERAWVLIDEVFGRAFDNPGHLAPVVL